MSQLVDSDDDDWFAKDDEELLKDVTTKIEKSKNQLDETTEYIGAAVSYDEKYLQEWRLNASQQTQEHTTKILTSDLRKLAEADNALDAFLYAFTLENAEFFRQQISANDSMDRVILYMRLYAMIAELKVPGFHLKVIEYFSQNDQLLDQLCVIATKLFNRRAKTLWKSDNDIKRLNRFVSDIQLLLLQTHALNAFTPKIISTIEHIKRVIKTSEFKFITDRKVIEEFAENLNEISNANSKDATKAVFDLSKQTNEIYPKFEELLECIKTFENVKKSSSEISPELVENVDDVALLENQNTATSEIHSILDDLHEADTTSDISLKSHVYKSVNEYLNIQKCALRNDFMFSLAECIQELRSQQKLSSAMATQVLLYENVEIILNENFSNAQRHEMLFINILPENTTKQLKSKIKFELRSLKTGSLVCLTTSYDFDNLILAMVTHQDVEYSKNGCVAIEIVRQFNIGNIYNKKLIMFSSPAFFEPYHNVYNYLNTCSVEDFPMRDIVVFGKQEIMPPNYITAKSIFTTNKCEFKPLQDAPPTELLLNSSQREAMQKVLRQKFALIQGPPGTGKTHLSVQLVKLLLENQTPKPIVVVAYTNESLDKFLLKISNHTTSIARLGGQTRSAEIAKFNIQGIISSDHLVNWRLKRLYFIVNTEFKAAFKELQKVQREFDGTDESYEQVLKAQNKVRSYAEQLNTMRIFFHYYVVRERSVLALTTTCAAKMNFLFRLLGCKIVIFEEAAEILESHVLACLTPQTEHVIMIGDHMQLKPFTLFYQHHKSHGLNISLFERLITSGILNASVLLTQYRMRPIIAELMCPIFYKELYNDKSVEQYPPVKGMLENLFFVQHNADEMKTVNKSYTNFYEVANIVNLANYLIKTSKYKTEDIVILSPYAQQCEMFKENLPGDLKSIRVMTVDSFQGLEADIVLLSLVRSNKERQIGFLQEKNRICVALSRAKLGFYIIGNLKMMCLNKTWRQIEGKLKKRKLVGKTFPYAEVTKNIINVDNLVEEQEELSNGIQLLSLTQKEFE